MPRLLAPIAVLAVLALAAPTALGQTGGGTPPAATQPAPAPPVFSPVRFRSSRAVGLPFRGRLVRGVKLPPEGEHFFSWDPIYFQGPNRSSRRWATARLIRMILAVAAEHRTAFPDAPRVAVGDLSRRRGGPFGARFGGLGHRSHQNGLDADIYYPRIDRFEDQVYGVSEMDRRLSQDLVNRFVCAGASNIWVGLRTRLKGPRKRVSKLAYHDDHLHVRIPRRPRKRCSVPTAPAPAPPSP